MTSAGRGLEAYPSPATVQISPLTSTQTAAGNGAYATASASVLGIGSNAANPAGFGAANGYIGGLSDTVSTLTHLGARDLDPVTGAFTSPDPILHTDHPAGFTPYAYSANDPINFSDPSGLDLWGDIGNFIGGAVNTFENFSNGLSDDLANFSLGGAVDNFFDGFSNLRWGSSGRPDTRPTGHLATLDDTANAPFDIAKANSGGWVPGNNATSGNPSSPVAQDYDQRINQFIGYWGTVAAVIPAGEGLAALSIRAAQRQAAEQLAVRQAGEATAEVAGDSVSLYRGLHYGHPAYDDALKGTARPWGGHSDPALHNGGNNRSVFTSWTTDQSIAREVASEGNGPGVVLRIPNADGPGYVRVPSPDIYDESEVLIRGPVFGAEVIR